MGGSTSGWASAVFGCGAVDLGVSGGVVGSVIVFAGSGGLGGVKQLGDKVLMICVHILSDTLRHHIIQPLVVMLD